MKTKTFFFLRRKKQSGGHAEFSSVGVRMRNYLQWREKRKKGMKQNEGEKEEAERVYIEKNIEKKRELLILNGSTRTFQVVEDLETEERKKR